MIIDDLILGFLLSRIFSKKEAQSPAVVFPPSSSAAPIPETGPIPETPPPALPGPSTPASPAPGAPSFPAQVSPPPDANRQAPPGYKRAVEVWQVQPSIAAQAGPVLHGLGVGAEAITIQMLESQFPKGWQGMKSATPAEAAMAKKLLAQWKDGGTVFAGAATLKDRRAYRMVKHPIAPSSSAQPAPPSSSAPPTPAPSAPGSVVTIPEVTITPGPDPGPVITKVRKGEGLANVAKRLGFPATAQSATAIQQANLPGPDGWYTATALAKGGLAKRGRAGGLQPGDRLFVPQNWAVDPGAL